MADGAHERQEGLVGIEPVVERGGEFVIGGVVVTRGEDVLRGQRLFVDLTSGVSRITSPFSVAKRTRRRGAGWNAVIRTER